jgi:hypothetical protein
VDNRDPSHNAQSFEPNPRYPEEVQGRDYHRDRAAQEPSCDQARTAGGGSGAMWASK